MRYRMEQGARPGNLKRGPGGLVDIEFVAQMLQLVHGGGDTRLRTPETCAALDRIREAGHLGDDDHASLTHAYRTIREIEGRLRLLDAPARHDFPETADGQRKLAYLLGCPDTDRLVNDVRALTARTRATFERIFEAAIEARR